jgi:hypothetical protein
LTLIGNPADQRSRTMTARVRRIAVAFVAAALASAVGAGVAAADHSSSVSVRADHTWCC